MPVNRNALIRLRTIDKCLQNRGRRWTLEDLIEACSEALYEYEGIDKGVSRRTVQMDIQLMRETLDQGRIAQAIQNTQAVRTIFGLESLHLLKKV